MRLGGWLFPVVCALACMGLTSASQGATEPPESAPPVVNGNGGEEVRPPAIGPLARAGRGAFNMLISPLEIPATMGRVASEKDAFFGLWAGGLEGLGNGLVRLCAGFVELVTSPIPSDRPPLYSKQLGERAFPPLRPPRNITRP